MSTLSLISCDTCGIVPLASHHARNRCPQCNDSAPERICTDIAAEALVSTLLTLAVDAHGKDAVVDYLDYFDQHCNAQKM
jgi:hypothetical protein